MRKKKQSKKIDWYEIHYLACMIAQITFLGDNSCPGDKSVTSRVELYAKKILKRLKEK